MNMFDQKIIQPGSELGNLIKTILSNIPTTHTGHNSSNQTITINIIPDQVLNSLKHSMQKYNINQNMALDMLLAFHKNNLIDDNNYVRIFDRIMHADNCKQLSVIINTLSLSRLGFKITDASIVKKNKLYDEMDAFLDKYFD